MPPGKMATKKLLINITLAALGVIILVVAPSSDSNNYTRAALGASGYFLDRPLIRRGHYGITSVIPEPSSAVLLLAGVGFRRRRPAAATE